MAAIIYKRESERGAAGAKLLFALLGLVLLANAGFNYVPVAYQGESFKQDMDGAIIKGTNIPTSRKPVDAVKVNIRNAALSNGIPEDVIIDVKQTGNAITGFVKYSKNVELLPFGLYVHTYHFEHTSAPTGFLAKNS